MTEGKKLTWDEYKVELRKRINIWLIETGLNDEIEYIEYLSLLVKLSIADQIEVFTYERLQAQEEAELIESNEEEGDTTFSKITTKKAVSEIGTLETKPDYFF